MHVAMTVIDSALFVQLVMTAFDLKRDPLHASRFDQPLGMLLNCVVRFCIEIFFLTKRWLNMPKGQSVYDKVSRATAQFGVSPAVFRPYPVPLHVHCVSGPRAVLVDGRARWHVA